MANARRLIAARVRGMLVDVLLLLALVLGAALLPLLIPTPRLADRARRGQARARGRHRRTALAR